MIAGGRVAAASGATYELREPATGRSLGTVADAGAADLERAVVAATAAQPRWRDAGPDERASVLYRAADLLEGRMRELAELDSRSSGKPIRDTLGEAGFAAAVFRYYAGAADKLVGQTVPTDSRGLLVTLREPIGIVAVITPYNAPLATMALKTAPALAAGNAVIGKPSPATPFTALRLAEILAEAGLPDGLFSVLTAERAELSVALVEHPSVGRISFTGSTAVGKDIARRTAGSLKRLTLELGGKSACIVFPDADIVAAAAAAPQAAFTNSGQDCCARSRLLVHESVRDEFVEAYVATARSLAIGDPLDESTVLGPLVSTEHRDRVHSYVEQGAAEGGRLLCGGEMLSVPGLEGGAFYAPTVIDSLGADSRVLREEIFGPVVAVQTFSTEKEAIALANASSFGLSGSLWTKDLGRSIRVARALDTGVLGVNSNSSVFLSTPFGGRKDSGVGHEYALTSLEENSVVKSVYFAAGV
jgi:betaine-aldehyde dehydrogenase